MPIKSKHAINWGLIAEAQKFYEDKGYKYLEVPWVVREDITRLTIPGDALPFSLYNYGDLVGSGEQSLVQLRVDNKIPAGKYQTITPCFRDDEVDELHQKHFMKLELIDFRTRNHSFDEVLSDALEFAKLKFDFLIPFDVTGGKLEVEEITETQKDINFHAQWWQHPVGWWDGPIELGSYGIRRVSYNGKNYSWNYGTGIAEPRFSYVMNHSKEAVNE